MSGHGRTYKSYDYLTYPREFVTYRWFKPLIVFAITVATLFAGTVACVCITALMTGSFSFATNVSSGGYDTMSPYSAPGAILSLGSVSCALLGLVIATRIVRDRPFSSYSTSRGGWKWPIFFKVFGISIVALTIEIIISYFLDPAANGNQFTLAGAIMCIILVPLQCISEEYLFRGLIAQAVGAWFKIPVLAIIVSSIIFASMHPYSIFGVISTFATGALFCILAWKTGGLEASSAMHVVNNSFAFGFAGLGFSKISTEVSFRDFFIQFVFELIVVAVVLYLGNKNNWFEPTGDGVTPFNEEAQKRLAQK